MASARYLHLHNHSEYSLLDGAMRIEDLVSTAKNMGMDAVALTDHGNMFGAIPFYKTAVSKGIKPIIGIETYVADGRLQGGVRTGRQARNDHLTLLVKDERGYRNLIVLSSKAYLEGFYYKPRIDLELLAAHSDGLIALSGCLQGGLPRRLLAGDHKGALDLADRLRSIFGPGGLYVELQNHNIPEEIRVIPELAKLARDVGLPLVVTNDCHFCRKDDHSAHDVLLCIQTGKDLDDPERVLRSNPETYFKSQDEMAALFSGYEDALGATLEIAEKCEFTMRDSSSHLPRFPIPEPFESANEYLEHVVMRSLAELMPSAGEDVLARARYELDVIKKMNFAGYFLVVWDIVRAAKERNIPVGPGRGSAAGSLVCYALGITSINPLENGLLFERLLNPERVSMPDIDVDFCDERRQEVIEYVINKYGKENVCQIITFGRMAARAVVRDVGRVLKVPYGDVDKLAKMIPAQPGTRLSKALSSVPELKDRYEQEPTVRKLIDLSLSLEGLARHASTHAAGIVITPTRLTDHVPLFRTNKGEVTTQYEMKVLEELGILKIDILGLKTLSHIDKTLKLIGQHEGVVLRMQDIPLDDPPTYELLQRGQTIAVFQLESAGMRDLLRKIKPTTFGDVIAVNALYRPGPLGSDMVSDFIERKHGRKKIAYEHPMLEPILRETYGVILYQEQVMQIASDLAGFTLGQADILRRAMGKKKKSVMERQRERFIKGAVERSIPKSKARTIFDLMTFFSGYGFNKSHSAAYAMVSMQTAYLKTHYPSAFMAAALTSDMSDTNRLMILLDECRNLGLVVHPPDINTGGVEFALSGGEITYGLAAIKNVGTQAMSSIVQIRDEGGPFRSLFEFCERIDLRVVNRRVIENLIQSGALDSLPGYRSQKMAALDRILAEAQKRQIARDKGQASLDLIDMTSEDGEVPLEDIPEWEDGIRLHREKESLGFYFSGHPLDKYRGLLGKILNVDSLSLPGKNERESVILACLISDQRVVIDRKGNPMAFVTVEDFFGSYEVIVFSGCYQRQRGKLLQDSIVVVRGKVSTKDRGESKVIADDIYTIDEALRLLSRRVHLTLHAGLFGESELERLKEIVGRFPGERDIVFHWRENGSDRYVVRARSARIEPGLEFVEELKQIAGVEHVEISS
jgi:DNA polymerase-3 subunit alpha